MHLSKKIKMFSQLFAAFLQSTFNLEQFEKRMSLIAYVFPKV